MSQIDNFKLPLNEFQKELDKYFDDNYVALPVLHEGVANLGYYAKNEPYSIKDEVNEMVETKYTEKLNAKKVKIYCEIPDKWKTYDEIRDNTIICISVVY